MSDGERNDEQPRGLYEKMKTQDDGWELWAIFSAALLGLQIKLFVVSYLPLGTASVYAHSVGISLLGYLTIPLALWGLIRALFRPPSLRLSRTIAFGCLLLTGLAGNSPVLPAPAHMADWESDHEYHLPFDGQWTTLAGGDSLHHNYHATNVMHRWGYDFAPVVDGERFEGDGSELEDHHCYGATVRAPVDGTVVEVLDGERDQPPGEQLSENILGNHVIIEVDDDEYLFMAHFREGSVQVGSGDEVGAGDRIAECGNTGHTLTPHLHVHLQNSAEFPFAKGLPLRFDDYLADGDPVDRGMPLGNPDYDEGLGQIVENRRSWNEMLGETDEPEQPEPEPDSQD